MSKRSDVKDAHDRHLEPGGDARAAAALALRLFVGRAQRPVLANAITRLRIDAPVALVDALIGIDWQQALRRVLASSAAPVTRMRALRDTRASTSIGEAATRGRTALSRARGSRVESNRASSMTSGRAALEAMPARSDQQRRDSPRAPGNEAASDASAVMPARALSRAAKAAWVAAQRARLRSSPLSAELSASVPGGAGATPRVELGDRSQVSGAESQHPPAHALLAEHEQRDATALDALDDGSSQMLSPRRDASPEPGVASASRPRNDDTQQAVASAPTPAARAESFLPQRGASPAEQADVAPSRASIAPLPAASHREVLQQALDRAGVDPSWP